MAIKHSGLNQSVTPKIINSQTVKKKTHKTKYFLLHFTAFYMLDWLLLIGATI